MTAPHAVLLAFLVFFFADLIVGRVLSALNARHIARSGTAVPKELEGVLPEDYQKRSVEYARVRSRFGHVSALFGALLTLVFLFSGILPFLHVIFFWLLALPPLWAGVAFLLSLTLLNSLLNLPLEIYQTFW